MHSSRSNERISGNRGNCTNVLAEMLVEDLNISEATVRRLARNGITTLGQLLSLCTDDLYCLYWIGKKSVQEIQCAIIELGFEPLGRHSPRATTRRIV